MRCSKPIVQVWVLEEHRADQVVDLAILRQQSAVRTQLLQDSLDILLPAGTLGYHNLDDGILGIVGSVALARPPMICLSPALADPSPCAPAERSRRLWACAPRWTRCSSERQLPFDPSVGFALAPLLFSLLSLCFLLAHLSQIASNDYWSIHRSTVVTSRSAGSFRSAEPDASLPMEGPPTFFSESSSRLEKFAFRVSSRGWAVLARKAGGGAQLCS